MVNVLVVHNEPGDDPTVDEVDVLAQQEAVVSALQATGHHVSTVGCTLNLEAFRQTLVEARPDVVFNLVESLAGTDHLLPLIPLLLDALRIPYTGGSSAAILATTGKLAAKRRLREAGLPTPNWLDASSDPAQHAVGHRERWIIKPVWEHASFGMDDEAVVEVTNIAALRQQLNFREESLRRPLFAERFVDGREFNLSLLAGEVLPPAEIDFSTFPNDKPRIVGRRAKWNQDSFEYQQTPRRFEFSDSDDALLDKLTQTAGECWRLFDLTGFARVDFRVDADGQLWILEVNVNPCLSPDAGFAAALEQAHIPYDSAIDRVLQEAFAGRTPHPSWP